MFLFGLLFLIGGIITSFLYKDMEKEEYIIGKVFKITENSSIAKFIVGDKIFEEEVSSGIPLETEVRGIYIKSTNAVFPYSKELIHGTYKIMTSISVLLLIPFIFFLTGVIKDFLDLGIWILATLIFFFTLLIDVYKESVINKDTEIIEATCTKIVEKILSGNTYYCPFFTYIENGEEIEIYPKQLFRINKNYFTVGEKTKIIYDKNYKEIDIYKKFLKYNKISILLTTLSILLYILFFIFVNL